MVRWYGKDGWILGFFSVAARSGVLNAGRVQMLQGIEQPLFLEIQGVVVGKRTGVDPGRSQGLDGRRWGSEMEDFGRTGPRLLVIRDSALQVDDAQVRSVQKGPHITPRLLGAQVIVKGLGDPAPEHHVAHKRQGNHLAAGADRPAPNAPHRSYGRITSCPGANALI